jgi:glutathionylspermidine synthase
MTLDARKSRERMNLGTLHAHNVVNPNPPYSKRIGDKRTVATPWNRFRAHNRAPLLPSQFEQSV